MVFPHKLTKEDKIKGGKVKSEAKRKANQSNSLKHGKYAKLPRNKLLRCDICSHRRGCDAYNPAQPDKVCVFPKKVRELVEALRTRNPELLNEERSRIFVKLYMKGKEDPKTLKDCLSYLSDEMKQIEGSKVKTEHSGSISLDFLKLVDEIREEVSKEEKAKKEVKEENVNT